MSKRITDIVSPKKEGVSVEKGEVQTRTPLKKGWVFVFFILILGGVFCYFTLSKANIEIWPETETLTFETKLTVDETAGASDFINKVIPGEIFEKEKTVAEIFPSSGKILKEEKAEGTIKVYNEYSTYPQILVATTRFVSAEGKLFRTPIKVTVPGGHYEKGELIPGEVDIKVVAAEAGPEYNIGPTTFSIPGFAGTARYTKFYAKSFQSMAGGLSEKLSQVTEEDLETAENILTKRAKEECEALLKEDLQSEEVYSEFSFSDEAIKGEIIEKFSVATPGKESEEFSFQVKTKCQTLIFKKEELRDFSKEFILPQIVQGKKLYEESLKIDYTPDTVDLDSGKINFSLVISAKIYSGINLSALKSNLKGNSLLETKLFLENQPEITKAKIELWPFWVKKVPEDLDKINLILRVD